MLANWDGEIQDKGGNTEFAASGDEVDGFKLIMPRIRSLGTGSQERAGREREREGIL